MAQQDKKNQWRMLMEIFEEISDLSPAERDKALRARTDNADVRARVKRMLGTLDHTLSILAAPLSDRVRLDPVWFTEPWVGNQIGSFKVEKLLHQGAIAGVFLGSQKTPVERKVAIKLLRADAPEQVAQFFRFEQQALAKLSHPNIAAIHTVDQTEDGLSFIVMEYIEGRELLDYCDTQALGIADRLALFLEICDAISYSHQRGILHRDIKSSNILVRNFEGRSVPTVIDFGIASDLTPGVQFDQGGLMGTPEYMSPEHVLRRDDLDARADVYSLGMVLFTLLAGRIPFERERIFKLDEARRLSLIAQFEPPLPSQYFKDISESEQMAVAAQRGASRRDIVGQLDAELDYIFRKATNKDREQRYASVADFAADIRSYREHRIVSAHPPGALYSVRKFVRRHAIASAAGLAIAILSTLFVAKLIDQNRSIRNEALRAEQQRRHAEDVVSMIVETMSVARPTGPSSDARTSLTEMLDKAYSRFQDSGDLTPDTRAMILLNLADSFRGVSDSERAREVEAMILDEIDTFGPLSQAQGFLILSNAARSDSKLHEAYDYALRAHLLCVEHDIGGMELINIKTALAETAKGLSKLDDADRLLQEASALINAQETTDLELLASVQLGLADLARLNFQYARAEEYFAQAKKTLRDHVGEDHADYVRTELYETQFLGASRSPNFTSASVGELLEKAIGIWGKQSDADNTLQFFMATALLYESQYEQATQTFKRNLLSLEQQDKKYGELYVLNLASLSPAYLEMENPELALDFATEAFELVTVPNEVGHKYGPYIVSAIELEYAKALAANDAWEDALFHVNSANKFFETNRLGEVAQSLTVRAFIHSQLQDHNAARADVEVALESLQSSERPDPIALDSTKLMRQYVNAVIRNDARSLHELEQAFNAFESIAGGRSREFPHNRIREYLLSKQ